MCWPPAREKRWLLRRARVADHFRAAAARRSGACVAPCAWSIVRCQRRRPDSLWSQQRALLRTDRHGLAGLAPARVSQRHPAFLTVTGPITSASACWRARSTTTRASASAAPGHEAIVPVVCTVTLVPQTSTEPAHLVCVVQDINEIHAARAALERSKNRAAPGAGRQRQRHVEAGICAL